MILWLDAIGAALMVASVVIWVWRNVKRSYPGWSQIDRHSLPDDQLGL